MKKKVLITLLTAVIIAASYFAYETYAASITVKGDVVDVVKVLRGQDGKITVDQAKSMMSKGQPVALKADNGKIYFIYAASGAYAVRKLAMYADKKVEVTGTSKKVGGLNVIIASGIDGK